MFAHRRYFFCSATPHELRLRLRRLRAISKAAQEEIRERRRRFQRAQKEFADFSSVASSLSSSAGVHVDCLPKNDALESAIALAISENRDARTELEFTRHFLNSSLISLASPVGPWDPYDTKPQVFALDQYFALPVFTSLAYLRLFCQRFRFTVRDPSGVLWVDGVMEEKEDIQNVLPPLPDVSKSEWWGRHVQQHLCASALEPTNLPLVKQATNVLESAGESDISCVDACDLFELMDAPLGGNNEANFKTRQLHKKKTSTHRVSRRRKKVITRHKGNSPLSGEGKRLPHAEKATRMHDAVHEAFWAKVRATAPFCIKQATPLPVFGPMLRPFFVGYFADVDTLLHNASIVPEKVDIVLNPSSPIEFVLSREATDRVLQKDQLLDLAYRRVERELRGEFHRFFVHMAPEVLWARSACVPCPVPGKPDEVRYELVILLQSDDFDRTLSCLCVAKRHCILMGHTDLDVLPWDTALPHVREASSLFYDRTTRRNDVYEKQGALGVFEQRGSVQTINVARTAESFYHDPTAAYTESHAVFTEELKVKRSPR